MMLRIALFLFLLVGPTVLPVAAEDSLEVQVGFYFLDLAKVDLRSNEFYADFYVWFKWKDAPAMAWNPDDVEFMNGAIDEGPPLSETLGDGSRLVTRRVKGTFRARFDFKRYPFDSQTLTIEIEDNTREAAIFRFVPALDIASGASNLLDESVRIPGWRIAGATLTETTHAYASTFGADLDSGLPRESYSRLAATVTIERLFAPHLIKFVIPLLVIAGMAYLVFYINAREFDAQCSICVTSLLSAVALHITQADALPAVGYLVVADKIFILFYIIILSALVQTVVVNNFAKRGHTAAAARTDEWFKILYPLALFTGSLGIILL